MKLALHWQIAIALILAAIAGTLTSETSSFLGVSVIGTYEFLGTLFLNGLKMLVVPLIASAVITGMMEIGKSEGFARLGMKTLAYYTLSSLLAILTGLVLVNLIQPGIIDGAPAKDLIGLSASTDQTLAKVSDKGGSDIVEVFLRMVPPNIINAAAKGQMLGLITFSLLFGFFLSRQENSLGQTMKTFWQSLFEIMMKMTHFIMIFAPIGVFGLVAKTISLTGFSAIGPLVGFFFTVLGALLIHAFLTIPSAILLIGKMSPAKHFKSIASALLTAFSTASSAATLPRTIECITEKAGVSRKVTSFTIPLGATVNMDGTALYECVAAIFIAQCYGIDLTFGAQFLIVITALLTSIGVAGIPSASLVAIIVILGAVGLPLEGIGLILVVDRILDMCRTSVNVLSDSGAAILIAKSEGESPLQN